MQAMSRYLGFNVTNPKFDSPPSTERLAGGPVFARDVIASLFCIPPSTQVVVKT
jgi:hypothetical protein